MTKFFLSNGKELSRECYHKKLNYDTVYKRIRLGYTPDEAVQSKINKKSFNAANVKYVINGEKVYRLCKTEKRPHYCYLVFLQRKKKGMSNEEAFFK